MRGLTTFIADIRACKTHEAEVKRINKELANIREKFGVKASKLDGYNKKKYVAKLIFIFLLGNDIEFGHLEAISLLSSTKYSEKQIGYMFCSVLLFDGSELFPMVVEAVLNDMRSTKELNVCLALNCIANMGGKIFSDNVQLQVTKLLTAGTAPDFVRKKAALALLRLYRHQPFEMDPDVNTKVIQILSHKDLGVVTSVASLIISMAQQHAASFKSSVPVVINRLHRITMSTAANAGQIEGVMTRDSDYMYYGCPAPWLSVKLLRLLQLYDEPSDATHRDRLHEALHQILQRTLPPASPTAPKRKAQYVNANQAVFFETTALIAHYDSDKDMQLAATKQLGFFFGENKPNVRFLALEGLSMMALTQFSRPAVKEHLPGVIATLHESTDTSVQRRAVDVLYGVCDDSNVESIVKDLLRFLKKSEFGVREEVVLKVAILAEKYAAAYTWYVNVILTLINMAGDHVADEVWHRVIHIIVNREEVQQHSSRICFQALLDPSCHENMVKVCTYVLGEFGHLIANDPASTPDKQLGILQMHYPMVSVDTRGMILSTYAKFCQVFPELKETVQQVLRAENVFRSAHAEIQQRANEYFNLTTVANPSVLPAVLEEMPPFPEEESSSLMSKLDRGKDVTDKLGGQQSKKPQTTLADLDGSSVVDAAEVPAPAKTTAPPPSGAPLRNQAFLAPFKSTDGGKLYESAVLQIGIKMEFVKQHARATLYYGNRSQIPFTEVSFKIYMPSDADKIKFYDVQDLMPTLNPGAQVPQVFKLECLDVFNTEPLIDLSLKFQDRKILLRLTVPITANKFIGSLGAALTVEQFGQKWQQLGATRETIEEVTVSTGFTRDSVVESLKGFKLAEMQNIDPRPENIVVAGIFHSAAAQVGVLVRVEPDVASKKIKFTIRGSNATVAPCLAKLLKAHFA